MDTNLKDLLYSIYNDKEFVEGVLHLTSHPDDRASIINFIKSSGEDIDPDEISLYAIELDRKRNPNQA
ncbi:MAG: hypothetical protein E7571_05395 [Ruminococcaceae bacterium]|nr:hypothetical protein [Oscillospiraceae bacterium]